MSSATHQSHLVFPSASVPPPPPPAAAGVVGREGGGGGEEQIVFTSSGSGSTAEGVYPHPSPPPNHRGGGRVDAADSSALSDSDCGLVVEFHRLVAAGDVDGVTRIVNLFFDPSSSDGPSSPPSKAQHNSARDEYDEDPHPRSHPPLHPTPRPSPALSLDYLVNSALPLDFIICRTIGMHGRGEVSGGGGDDGGAVRGGGGGGAEGIIIAGSPPTAPPTQGGGANANHDDAYRDSDIYYPDSGGDDDGDDDDDDFSISLQADPAGSSDSSQQADHNSRALLFAEVEYRLGGYGLPPLPPAAGAADDGGARWRDPMSDASKRQRAEWYRVACRGAAWLHCCSNTHSYRHCRGESHLAQDGCGDALRCVDGGNPSPMRDGHRHHRRHRSGTAVVSVALPPEEYLIEGQRRQSCYQRAGGGCDNDVNTATTAGEEAKGTPPKVSFFASLKMKRDEKKKNNKVAGGDAAVPFIFRTPLLLAIDFDSDYSGVYTPPPLHTTPAGSSGGAAAATAAAFDHNSMPVVNKTQYFSFGEYTRTAARNLEWMQTEGNTKKNMNSGAPPSPSSGSPSPSSPPSPPPLPLSSSPHQRILSLLLANGARDVAWAQCEALLDAFHGMEGDAEGELGADAEEEERRKEMMPHGAASPPTAAQFPLLSFDMIRSDHYYLFKALTDPFPHGSMGRHCNNATIATANTAPHHHHQSTAEAAHNRSGLLVGVLFRAIFCGNIPIVCTLLDHLLLNCFGIVGNVLIPATDKLFPPQPSSSSPSSGRDASRRPTVDVSGANAHSHTVNTDDDVGGRRNAEDRLAPAGALHRLLSTLAGRLSTLLWFVLRRCIRSGITGTNVGGGQSLMVEAVCERYGFYSFWLQLLGIYSDRDLRRAWLSDVLGEANSGDGGGRRSRDSGCGGGGDQDATGAEEAVVTKGRGGPSQAASAGAAAASFSSSPLLNCNTNSRRSYFANFLSALDKGRAACYSGIVGEELLPAFTFRPRASAPPSIPQFLLSSPSASYAQFCSYFVGANANASLNSSHFAAQPSRNLAAHHHQQVEQRNGGGTRRYSGLTVPAPPPPPPPPQPSCTAPPLSRRRRVIGMMGRLIYSDDSDFDDFDAVDVFEESVLSAVYGLPMSQRSVEYQSPSPTIFKVPQNRQQQRQHDRQMQSSLQRGGGRRDNTDSRRIDVRLSNFPISFAYRPLADCGSMEGSDAARSSKPKRSERSSSSSSLLVFPHPAESLSQLATCVALCGVVGSWLGREECVHGYEGVFGGMGVGVAVQQPTVVHAGAEMASSLSFPPFVSRLFGGLRRELQRRSEPSSDQTTITSSPPSPHSGMRESPSEEEEEGAPSQSIREAMAQLVLGSFGIDVGRLLDAAAADGGPRRMGGGGDGDEEMKKEKEGSDKKKRLGDGGAVGFIFPPQLTIVGPSRRLLAADRTSASSSSLLFYSFPWSGSPYGYNGHFASSTPTPRSSALLATTATTSSLSLSPAESLSNFILNTFSTAAASPLSRFHLWFSQQAHVRSAFGGQDLFLSNSIRSAGRGGGGGGPSFHTAQHYIFGASHHLAHLSHYLNINDNDNGAANDDDVDDYTAASSRVRRVRRRRNSGRRSNMNPLLHRHLNATGRADLAGKVGIALGVPHALRCPTAGGLAPSAVLPTRVVLPLPSSSPSSSSSSPIPASSASSPSFCSLSALDRILFDEFVNHTSRRLAVTAARHNVDPMHALGRLALNANGGPIMAGGAAGSEGPNIALFAVCEVYLRGLVRGGMGCGTWLEEEEEDAEIEEEMNLTAAGAAKKTLTNTNTAAATAAISNNRRLAALVESAFVECDFQKLLAVLLSQCGNSFNASSSAAVASSSASSSTAAAAAACEYAPLYAAVVATALVAKEDDALDARESAASDRFRFTDADGDIRSASSRLARRGPAVAVGGKEGAAAAAVGIDGGSRADAQHHDEEGQLSAVIESLAPLLSLDDCHGATTTTKRNRKSSTAMALEKKKERAERFGRLSYVLRQHPNRHPLFLLLDGCDGGRGSSSQPYSLGQGYALFYSAAVMASRLATEGFGLGDASPIQPSSSSSGGAPLFGNDGRRMGDYHMPREMILKYLHSNLSDEDLEALQGMVGGVGGGDQSASTSSSSSSSLAVDLLVSLVLPLLPLLHRSGLERTLAIGAASSPNGASALAIGSHGVGGRCATNVGPAVSIRLLTANTGLLPAGGGRGVLGGGACAGGGRGGGDVGARSTDRPSVVVVNSAGGGGGSSSVLLNHSTAAATASAPSFSHLLRLPPYADPLVPLPSRQWSFLKTWEPMFRLTAVLSDEGGVDFDIKGNAPPSAALGRQQQQQQQQQQPPMSLMETAAYRNFPLFIKYLVEENSEILEEKKDGMPTLEEAGKREAEGPQCAGGGAPSPPSPSSRATTVPSSSSRPPHPHPHRSLPSPAAQIIIGAMSGFSSHMNGGSDEMVGLRGDSGGGRGSGSCGGRRVADVLGPMWLAETGGRPRTRTRLVGDSDGGSRREGGGGGGGQQKLPPISPPPPNGNGSDDASTSDCRNAVVAFSSYAADRYDPRRTVDAVFLGGGGVLAGGGGAPTAQQNEGGGEQCAAPLAVKSLYFIELGRFSNSIGDAMLTTHSYYHCDDGGGVAEGEGEGEGVGINIRTTDLPTTTTCTCTAATCDDCRHLVHHCRRPTASTPTTPSSSLGGSSGPPSAVAVLPRRWRYTIPYVQRNVKRLNALRRERAYARQFGGGGARGGEGNGDGLLFAAPTTAVGMAMARGSGGERRLFMGRDAVGWNRGNNNNNPDAFRDIPSDEEGYDEDVIPLPLRRFPCPRSSPAQRSSLHSIASVPIGAPQTGAILGLPVSRCEHDIFSVRLCNGTTATAVEAAQRSDEARTFSQQHEKKQQQQRCDQRQHMPPSTSPSLPVSPLVLSTLSPLCPFAYSHDATGASNLTSNLQRLCFFHFLIRNGGSVNAAREGGRTPLMLAVSLCAVEMVEVMMNRVLMDERFINNSGGGGCASRSGDDDDDLLMLLTPLSSRLRRQRWNVRRCCNGPAAQQQQRQQEALCVRLLSGATADGGGDGGAPEDAEEDVGDDAHVFTCAFPTFNASSSSSSSLLSSCADKLGATATATETETSPTHPLATADTEASPPPTYSHARSSSPYDPSSPFPRYNPWALVAPPPTPYRYFPFYSRASLSSSFPHSSSSSPPPPSSLSGYPRHRNHLLDVNAKDTLPSLGMTALHALVQQIVASVGSLSVERIKAAEGILIRNRWVREVSARPHTAVAHTAVAARGDDAGGSSNDGGVTGVVAELLKRCCDCEVEGRGGGGASHSPPPPSSSSSAPRYHQSVVYQSHLHYTSQQVHLFDMLSLLVVEGGADMSIQSNTPRRVVGAAAEGGPNTGTAANTAAAAVVSVVGETPIDLLLRLLDAAWAAKERERLRLLAARRAAIDAHSHGDGGDGDAEATSAPQRVPTTVGARISNFFKTLGVGGGKRTAAPLVASSMSAGSAAGDGRQMRVGTAAADSSNTMDRYQRDSVHAALSVPLYPLLHPFIADCLAFMLFHRAEAVPSPR